MERKAAIEEKNAEDIVNKGASGVLASIKFIFMAFSSCQTVISSNSYIDYQHETTVTSPNTSVKDTLCHLFHRGTTAGRGLDFELWTRTIALAHAKDQAHAHPLPTSNFQQASQQMCYHYHHNVTRNVLLLKLW